MLLKMMDETMIQRPTYIRAGIWSKQNKFIFQVDDEKTKDLILNHRNAGRHAHAIIVKEVSVTIFWLYFNIDSKRRTMFGTSPCQDLIKRLPSKRLRDWQLQNILKSFS